MRFEGLSEEGHGESACPVCGRSVVCPPFRLDTFQP